MAEEAGNGATVVQKRGATRGLTLDWWAVLLSLGLALLVRAGVVQHIGW